MQTPNVTCCGVVNSISTSHVNSIYKHLHKSKFLEPMVWTLPYQIIKPFECVKQSLLMPLPKP